MSASRKGRKPMLEKNHSEETKLKIKDKTHRENHPRFGKKSASATSQYFGVVLDKRYGTWIAKFTLDGKKVYIGSFNDEISAALAYDKYIKDNDLKNNLNFPETKEQGGI